MAFTPICQNRTRFKVGLARSRIALQYIKSPGLLADASRLPFDDESFDACMSMEMLEHLAASIYPIALSELERIARKYILISVPYNEKLKYNTVICPACRHAFHPYNHVRQYRSKDIETIFSPRFKLVKFTALAPVKREALPGLWNMIRVYQHRQGRNFPNTAICPQCGYKTGNHVVSGKHAPQAQSVIKNLRQLWPKRATFTWWMALYRKDVIR